MRYTLLLLLPAFNSTPNRDPPWAIKNVDINIFLSNNKKNITLLNVYKTKYRKLLNGEYREWFVPNNNLGIGSAVITDHSIKSESLSCEASIFTAELYAISMALNMIIDREEARSVIFGDSKSACKFWFLTRIETL